MPNLLWRLIHRGDEPISLEYSAPEQLLPVRIVHDGMLGSGLVGDGRLFPAVVIDTSERPDLDDVIGAHQSAPDSPGEIRTIWTRTGKCRLDLILEFKEPVATIAVLSLDSLLQGALIEQINFAHGLYVFVGREGDRVSQKAIDGGGGILAEVGEYSKWEPMVRECLERDFRSKGMKKKVAREAAAKFIGEWRSTVRRRFGI